MLAAVYLSVLLATMDIGFARDEGYYFKAGELYSRWFAEIPKAIADGAVLRPFTREVVDEHFAYNPEHPVIYKSLFGLSWRLLSPMDPPVDAPPWQRKRWYRGKELPSPGLGWLRESSAFRLPTAVTAALLLWLLYLFGTEAWDRRVGLCAALVMATLPRAFFHAHLAAFDYPIAFWVTATIYTFWRSLGRGWGSAVLCGVVWGISVGVKLNGLFTPFILLGWWVLDNRRELLARRWPPIPRAFFAMAVLGPLLFFGLWPRLWFDTVERTRWYLARHWNHEYYWAYYFGRLLVRPPFPVAFPFAMSLVTIPMTTLALVGAGLVAAARRGPRRGRRGAALLVLFAAIVPFLLIANPGTPVFGGTKHWLTAMPFLSLFAGVGFARLCDAVTEALGHAWVGRERAIVGALAVLFTVPPAFAVAHSHPDTVVYYNELLGGMSGAGKYGMQREFWGSTAGQEPVLRWLDRTRPVHAGKVHWHDTNWDSYVLYLRDGRLDPKVEFTWQHERANVSLFHWHKEFLDLSYEMAEALGGGVPHYVYARDGVPLLVAYGPPPKTPTR